MRICLTNFRRSIWITTSDIVAVLKQDELFGDDEPQFTWHYRRGKRARYEMTTVGSYSSPTACAEASPAMIRTLRKGSRTVWKKRKRKRPPKAMVGVVTQEGCLHIA